MDLVNKLSGEDVTIIIHIDAKADISKFAFIREALPGSIFFVDPPLAVYWGGLSQVNATLEMIKLAFSLKIDFEYAHFLSGQDIPVVSNIAIRNFLGKNKGLNFLDFNKLPFYRWQRSGGLDRVRYYWFSEKIGSKMAQVFYLLQKAIGFKRKFFPDMELYGGSNWWTLTREALEYIQEKGAIGTAYYRRFRYTLCPDEIYFQTLLLNSPLKQSIVSDNLRYIDWDTGPHWPRMLNETDYETIIRSGKLFARKIDNNDNRLVQMLAARYPHT